MISPELWDNQGFGELSLLAKVLFIGMISQADDDGKGLLSAQYLKSRIFPYNELRIADIEKALNEIGCYVSSEADTDGTREEKAPTLSVRYYEVGGKQYYIFENWRKWQSICRPIPSKLPNPPIADGEGGGVHSHEVFNDNSMSIHEQLNEYSRTIEIGIEKNKTHNAGEENNEFEAQLNGFCSKWKVVVDNYSPLIVDLDFVALDKAYTESTKFLQVDPVARTISWIIRNAASICAGKYKDRKPKNSVKETDERIIPGELRL